MNGCLEHMIWLTPESGGDLLACVLCGDEIMAPMAAGAWLKPAGVSRGGGVMLLRYEGAGQSLGFCLVAPAEATPRWVADLRASLAVAAAERRWGPFIRMLRRHEPGASSPAAHWRQVEIVHEGALWRARHACHPSALIDRLAQRDRADSEDRVRTAFGRTAPEREARRPDAYGDHGRAPH